jgi:hypothetical protein
MNIRTCPQSLRCKLGCEIALRFTHKLKSASDYIRTSADQFINAPLTQRGISGLMRFVTEEERNGNVDVQYSLRHQCFECLLREEVTASDVSP